jgi:hypothetical protein
MTEDGRFRILAGEHLPDGVASQTEFLDFFRHLLRASGDRLDAQETEVRVVCWLIPDGVHHHIAIRARCTGRLCCRFEAAIAMRVNPPELDRHANDLARLLSEALNPQSSPPPPRESGDAQ